MALWLPTDTANAGTGWLDANDASTIMVASGAASQITSKGSLSIVGSNSTPAAQPLYNASARNGTGGLILDGSNDFLSLTTTNIPTGDLTILLAGYMNTPGFAGQWRRLFGLGGSRDDNQSIQFVKRGSDNKAAEMTIGPGTSTADWMGLDHLMMVVKSGTTGSLYIDDVLVGTGTFAATLLKTVAYIGRGVQYADFWPGIFQQLVVHDRVLTEAERRRLFGWASWATGQAGKNLASDNPYLTAAPTTDGGAPVVPATRPRRILMLR